jgi:hypothetical protein
MGVTASTTFAYISQLIGEGKLRYSDVLLTVPADRRVNPRSVEDKEIVRRYGAASSLMGEIYEDVRFLELLLHHRISAILQHEYGKDEMGWWRMGIPEPIRKKCQERREEDEDPTEPFNYTDLLDLRSIIDKKWSIIKPHIPATYEQNKSLFMDDLLKLNNVRRLVMHPVRGATMSEGDFDFLRHMRRLFEDYLLDDVGRH